MSKITYITFTIEPFNIPLNISSTKIDKFLDSHHVRSKAIKTTLSRKRYDIIKLLQDNGFETYKCGFCGEFNTNFVLDTECDIDNKKIHIKGTFHKHSFNKVDQPKYYCFHKNKECTGYKLNPNSVQFIMGSRNLNYEDALNYLHSRNLSPFYSKNHDSLEGYKLSQARDKNWCDNNGIDYEQRNKNMVYGKSDEAYIKRYGKDGLKIKKEHNQKKAITLNVMISKYGEELGKQKYENWKFDVKHDKETYIKKYGEEGLLLLGNYYLKKTNLPDNENYKPVKTYDDLVDISYYLLVTASKDPVPYLIKNSPLHRGLEHYSSINSFLEFFDKTIDILINDIKNRYKDVHSIDAQKTPYSYFSYTDSGRILKSYGEIKFYNGLKEIGYTDESIKVNCLYPNSNYFYDFYLPDIHSYIEIAGLMDDSEYKKKMKLKENLFNSIIVLPNDIENVLNEIKTKRNNI